jgi:hypothetical protein
VHRRQVRIDRQPRRGMRPEAFELRMLPVTTRFIAKHGTGEQSLAPQRDQSLPIQVPGMQRPQPHCNRA